MQTIGTRCLLLVAALFALNSTACAPSIDCSAQQGWSEEHLTLLSVQPAPSIDAPAVGVGITVFAAPEMVFLNGTHIPGIVASPRLSIPVVVEAHTIDGGPSPFRLAVLVDGKQTPYSTTLNAGDKTFVPDENGRLSFDLTVDGSGLGKGAHDVAIAFSRPTLAAVAGLRLTWIRDSTHWPPGAGPTAGSGISWGRGSSIRSEDGGVVLEGADLSPPRQGLFSWTAIVESRVTTCGSAKQRSRLLAILDGATQIEINDSEFIELEYPSDQATSLPIHFSGLPTDSGHRIDLIQLDSVDRFQFFPDGRASNWFSPLVADVGSAAW